MLKVLAIFLKKRNKKNKCATIKLMFFIFFFYKLWSKYIYLFENEHICLYFCESNQFLDIFDLLEVTSPKDSVHFKKELRDRE